MLALGDMTRDASWFRRAVDAGETRAFAKLAATTADSDEARKLYESDPALRVPEVITSYRASGPVQVRL